MEKETCICKEKLDDIAIWIYQNYKIKLYFCKILGKRWSFYAGLNNLIVPEERIKITDKWGIFVDKINVEEDTWDEILCSIKRVIEDI